MKERMQFIPRQQFCFEREKKGGNKKNSFKTVQTTQVTYVDISNP